MLLIKLVMKMLNARKLAISPNSLFTLLKYSSARASFTQKIKHEEVLYYRNRVVCLYISPLTAKHLTFKYIYNWKILFIFKLLHILFIFIVYYSIIVIYQDLLLSDHLI